MATKYNDALSILNEKSLVDELEKELQLSQVQRSEVSELIERSVKEADQELIERADIFATDEKGDLVIPKAEMPTVKKLLKKLTLDGVVDENDDTANQISKMLNWLSSFLEHKSEAKVEIMADETVKSDESVQKDMGEVSSWKPYGGAMSLADAKAYLDTQKMQNNLSNLYYDFGCVASNIMSCEMEDVSFEDKIKQLQALVVEFKNNLTPQKLMEMSQAEMPVTEQKQEEQDVIDQTIVKSLSDKVDGLEKQIEKLVEQKHSADANVTKSNAQEVIPSAETKNDNTLVNAFQTMLSEAVTKPQGERTVALQNILNFMGEQFKSLDTVLVDQEIEKSGIAPDVLRGVTADVEEVKAQVGAMNAQITKLSELIQQSLVSRATVPNKMVLKNPNIRNEVPVQKSMVVTQNPVQVPQVKSNGKGMSIADIARKTVTGN